MTKKSLCCALAGIACAARKGRNLRFSCSCAPCWSLPPACCSGFRAQSGRLCCFAAAVSSRSRWVIQRLSISSILSRPNITTSPKKPRTLRRAAYSSPACFPPLSGSLSLCRTSRCCLKVYHERKAAQNYTHCFDMHLCRPMCVLDHLRHSDAAECGTHRRAAADDHGRYCVRSAYMAVPNPLCAGAHRHNPVPTRQHGFVGYRPDGYV